MLVYLGFFYILIGVLILSISLLYIELGRPKDLIKAGLNLIIGMTLIINKSIFNSLNFLLLIVFSILVSFYLIEIFTIRWNQLTDQEKNKLKTFLEFQKNLIKLIEAITLLNSKFLSFFNLNKSSKDNENLITKKWVRNEKNVKVLPSNKNAQLNLDMEKKGSAQLNKIEEKKQI